MSDLSRARTIYEQQPKLTPEQQEELAFIGLAVNGEPLMQTSPAGKPWGLLTVMKGIQTIRQTLEALKKAYDSAKATYGATDPRVLPSLTSLAQLLATTGQYTEAKPLIEQGFSIRVQNQQANADYDKELYDLRSRVEWAEGRRTEAVTDLRKSLEQIQAFVQRAIGSELDRAQSEIWTPTWNHSREWSVGAARPVMLNRGFLRPISIAAES